MKHLNKASWLETASQKGGEQRDHRRCIGHTYGVCILVSASITECIVITHVHSGASQSYVEKQVVDDPVGSH